MEDRGSTVYTVMHEISGTALTQSVEVAYFLNAVGGQGQCPAGEDNHMYMKPFVGQWTFEHNIQQ